MKKVLTFGVYDMLHIGHIPLFKRAKELGDYLIVAVQDGDFIKKYKPQAEMVYSTEERAFMVSCIKYVDEVIIYKDVEKTSRVLTSMCSPKAPTSATLVTKRLQVV